MNTAKIDSIYKKQKVNIKKDNNLFTQVKNILTTSGNGSLKLTTTGNIFVDDFSLISNYKQRELEDIVKTIEPEFQQDPLLATKLVFYIRTITREPKKDDIKYNTHRGTGWRHEFVCRMLYVSATYPEIFKKNFWLIPILGSWRDVVELLRYDLYYNGKPTCIDWNFILEQIKISTNAGLVLKYLPSIKSSKKCKTLKQQANNYIGKYIANSNLLAVCKNKPLAVKYRAYNKLKASFAATDWQKCISEQNYDLLDFSTIPGRALEKLVQSKFLNNHGLIKRYNDYMRTQPTLKFTGFPFELFKKEANFDYQKETINKQFEQLVKTSNINALSNLIVCLDISGSMSANVQGFKNTTALSIAKSMALMMSYSLKGKFKNTFLTFSSEVEIHTWQYDTPYDNFWKTKLGYFGNTNFSGVATLLCKLKSIGYKEEEFPTGVLCISDGEFNGYSEDFGTNFTLFKKKLLKNDFSKEFVDNFQLILWDIPNTFYSYKIKPKFEGLADCKNFFYLSGFDPAIIQFLFGKEPETKIPKTAKELFEAAMDQELLNKIKI